MIYTLTLVNEDSEVVEQWKISTKYDPDNDFENGFDPEEQNLYDFYVIADDSKMGKNSEIIDIGKSVWNRVNYLEGN